jgi:hypothetical protein
LSDEEANKELALEVAYDGATHVLPLKRFTAAEDMECRTKIGVGIMDVLSSEGPLQVREVACLLWLWLRRSKMQLTYEQVAKKFDVGHMADVEMKLVKRPEA